jgi:hypothetical protein
MLSRKDDGSVRAVGLLPGPVLAPLRLVVVAFAVLLAPVLLALAAIDSKSAWGLAFLGFLVVGVIVLSRRPDNVIGWLLFVVGASTGLLVVDQWYVRSSLGPGPVAVELVFLPLGTLPWIALILLVVLFPDGHSTTRLQSFLVPAVVLVGIVGLLGQVTQPDGLASKRPNPLAVHWIAPAASWLIGGPGFLIVPAMLLAALVSLILRWRGSRGERRLQFRWLTWGGGITLVAVAGSFFFSGAVWSVVGVILVLGFWAIPVAIGIAVTRYRLYDIDRIISRSASYALVSLVVLLAYASVVTSASHLLGSQSSVVVAAATLVAAALFRPLLSRVQRVVDRRFNREKFDGLREIEDFGALLRDEVHPDRAVAELLAVTRRTLAPTSVALWIVDGRFDPDANALNAP